MSAGRSGRSFVGGLFHHLMVAAGGLALTMFFFLVLPVMQTISKPPETDTILRAVEAGKLEAPPPIEEAPKEEESKQEDKLPELKEPSQLLNLDQLAMALNPTLSDGAFGGEVAAIGLGGPGGPAGEPADEIAHLSELDQKPRVIYQPMPTVTAKIRQRTQTATGTVWIIFIVDKNGRVEKPVVQKCSDPVFEGPALAAVKQWKFEPGKRNGQPVRFRMRVPITFPKGLGS